MSKDRRIKFDKEKTVMICIKLNKNTDADIIRHLERQSNKAGYIKALIRGAISRLTEDIL